MQFSKIINERFFVLFNNLLTEVCAALSGDMMNMRIHFNDSEVCAGTESLQRLHCFVYGEEVWFM